MTITRETIERAQQRMVDMCLAEQFGTRSKCERDAGHDGKHSWENPFITICAGCKPIGRMEEISIGVLIGKCEVCNAQCPPTQLNKYRRREYEIARTVQDRMMPGVVILVVDELPEDP